MNELHHNQPPDMAATAGEVVRGLSDWMAENPMIETEDQARQAKEWNDRAYLCVKDMEDERTEKVRPLNEQVKKINSHYKAPRELLETVTSELKTRLHLFILREEAKRIAAAEEARRVARQMEEDARAMERREREAYADVDAGILGVDVADATANANQAFAGFEKAQRQAQLAERETKVKIGGGFRRSLSLRETEVIYIENPLLVVAQTGWTDGIKTELLKAARAYKKLHGKYPDGITVTLERGT